MPNFYPLAVLAIAFMPLPLRASPAVVVSLQSIGSRVRAQNPDLAAARLRIQEALGRMKQSGRLANPQLETGIEQNSGFREGRIEVGLSQRFPVTDRLRLEKEISLSELQSSEAEVREIECQLVGKACETVVKILANRQRRSLLNQQADVSQQFADFLREIATKGEGSPLDAGLAKLEAATLTLEIRQLDVGETALIGELKLLLGMRAEEALHLNGALPDPSSPPRHVDPSRRPDFQMAKHDELAAAQGVALAQSRRYDDLEGSIFVGAERAEDAPNGYNNEAIIALRLKIPLPFWNHNEGAIQEARAKQQRKELEVVALGRQIQLEVSAARAEMADWSKMIEEINVTLLPLADEQATLAEAAFRNGQGEIQSVLRSREKRLQLAAARLDALREFHLARIRHETARGGGF